MDHFRPRAVATRTDAADEEEDGGEDTRSGPHHPRHEQWLDEPLSPRTRAALIHSYPGMTRREMQDSPALPY